jgi:hypothetical protein
MNYSGFTTDWTAHHFLESAGAKAQDFPDPVHSGRGLRVYSIKTEGLMCKSDPRKGMF